MLPSLNHPVRLLGEPRERYVVSRCWVSVRQFDSSLAGTVLSECWYSINSIISREIKLQERILLLIPQGFGLSTFLFLHNYLHKHLHGIHLLHASKGFTIGIAFLCKSWAMKLICSADLTRNCGSCWCHLLGTVCEPSPDTGFRRAEFWVSL